MRNSSWVTAIIAFTLTLFAAYPIYYSVYLHPTMPTSHHIPQASPDRQIPIKISISSASADTASNPPSVVLKTTITNLSPSPVSILTWSSPLDPRAAALGVFVFTSTTTRRDAPCIELMLNRQLPESNRFETGSEEVVTIAGGKSVEKEVRIGEPDLLLQAGEKYEVKVQGNWMGVWVGEKKDGFRLAKEDGLLTGEFKSEIIEVQL